MAQITLFSSQIIPTKVSSPSLKGWVDSVLCPSVKEKPCEMAGIPKLHPNGPLALHRLRGALANGAVRQDGCKVLIFPVKTSLQLRKKHPSGMVSQILTTSPREKNT